ncbi:unnamed protein product [Psylliodes chrysocephalus]|uniref:Ionotropic glutamate receptor C-terminal domain-containing protein n=1 Tax=Psylliodes chrysocephalus TaxID=3402493 RepID=A0A9P0GCJ3_9CUCU|nr:unnamed protein product [Psylliodes chrysocephala]
MGIAEIFLAGLCLNATCDDDYIPSTSIKLLRFAKLEQELQTETLVITTLQNGELSGYETVNDTVVGTGIAFDIIKILQDKYKFNYTIVLPEDDTFLGEQSQKTAKKLLETKKVDLAVAFLPIIENIRNEIVYSTSFDVAEWAVLMNRPDESATGSGLLAPFTTQVWILIIFSILVVGPIIFLMVLLRARLCRDDKSEVYSLSTCLWFVYGALLKQGSTVNPRTDSSRLLFSTWWLFILILTAFYTANLTAFLTLSKFTLPITTPEEIGKKHYSWVTNRGNPVRDKIISEKNDEHIYQDKLIKTIGNLKVFANHSDMNILNTFVKKRKMMFIREKTVINHIMYQDYREKAKNGVEEEHRCTFVVAKFPITKFSRAFAYSKDFKYVELFDYAIQRLIEGGIIEFKLNENLPDAQICPLDLGSTERKLRNTDLLLTYILVGGGLAVALCVFLMEILWRVCQRRNKQKKKRKPHQTHFLANNYNAIIKTGLSNLTPPPSYQTLFKPPFYFKDEGGKKTNINGRDYWIVNGKNGFRQMIPLRTPSALLFQFSN